MKILICPLNGPRNISEFTYGGEYHPLADPQKSNDRAWADYVFFHDNHAGIVIEWWCHTASSYWFLAERDTRTDNVVRTFPASELATSDGRS
ncbi:MAG: sarcosine oxidase subunit delta [Gammaproteobacteria bacterium]|nr:sarcosine oxidase subunit delta [Gammaproteobacteria bacterium]